MNINRVYFKGHGSHIYRFSDFYFATNQHGELVGSFDTCQDAYDALIRVGLADPPKRSIAQELIDGLEKFADALERGDFPIITRPATDL